MLFNLEYSELKDMLYEAAKGGARQALIETGVWKDEISQNRAWTLYGRGIIESLRNRGLIKRQSGEGGNSKCTYSRCEIEAALIFQRNKIKK